MAGTETAPLLVELLVEELPPQALKALGAAFADGIANGLIRAKLKAAASDWTSYATPRRLAVLIPDVLHRAVDRAQEIKLMPASVGLNTAGDATPALLKRLAAIGVDAGVVPRLKRRVDGKSEVLFLDSVVAGLSVSEGLQLSLDETLARLPIPKVMQYQLADGWTSVSFVRPAHGLVALHGDTVVPVRALGLEAGRDTLGHRFEALISPIALRTASSYADQLRDEGAVIANFAERRAEVGRQLDRRAAAELGLKPIADEALLDEVTALVERPNVLPCEFEAEFLAVPPECLILTMKANQKYFPLLDVGGALSNRFLIVSNITPADPSHVIQGNERVVRPRLADAKFFFDQDRKKTLASRVPGLDKVVYHAKLGTQGERTTRVRAIAKAIAKTAFAHEHLDEQADRAALLAKADLLTDMVGEFPELQGVMGGYYARHDRETAEVADAIEDHYRPRFAGDQLPRGKVGLIVALADKLETLVGLFGIGQSPTGDRDPFALRRHALGVVRMLIDKQVPTRLEDLVALALPAFGAAIEDPTKPLLAFIYERLAGSLREQGYSVQEIDAVFALPKTQLTDMRSRLDAVRAFAALPEAPSLAAANKRVGNILKKSAGEASPEVDSALLADSAEAALYASLLRVETKADIAFRRGEYTPSLQALAALKAPVDTFFDHVMVNAEDPALRANRLGLLAKLHAAMNRIADLSRLVA
jgi:glycyl-tRNA synthetase beta chain